VHFIPLHVQTYYRETFGLARASLPVALDLYERSVSLPIYSRMTDEDVAHVVQAIRDVVSAFARAGRTPRRAASGTT
jgi:perosamine synthetase